MRKPGSLTQNPQNGLRIVWQPGPEMQNWVMQRKRVHERQYILYMSCSVTKSYLTVCHPIDCSTPGFPVFHCLPEFIKLMSIESVIPSNYLILCLPLLLPSVFPSIGSSLMSWLFASGGQSIRASASASILLMNIQGWFPLGWAG